MRVYEKEDKTKVDKNEQEHKQDKKHQEPGIETVAMFDSYSCVRSSYGY